MKPYQTFLSYKISVYNTPVAQSPSFCIMKAALLFCLLAAGASIAFARYKSSDFSEEGTWVFRYCMYYYTTLITIICMFVLQRDGKQLCKLSEKQKMVSQNSRCSNREPGLRNDPVQVQQDCCPDSSDVHLDGASGSGRLAYSWKVLCVKQSGF